MELQDPVGDEKEEGAGKGEPTTGARKLTNEFAPLAFFYQSSQ